MTGGASDPELYRQRGGHGAYRRMQQFGISDYDGYGTKSRNASKSVQRVGFCLRRCDPLLDVPISQFIPPRPTILPGQFRHPQRPRLRVLITCSEHVQHIYQPG